jgi:predicted TIM-barrel fold metal-dependent hydrolase
MHDATQAAQELKRAVKELGLLGAILNDFQETENGTKALYYDGPDYDPFWAMVQELDGNRRVCSSNFSTCVYSSERAACAGV